MATKLRRPLAACILVALPPGDGIVACAGWRAGARGCPSSPGIYREPERPAPALPFGLKLTMGIGRLAKLAHHMVPS